MAGDVILREVTFDDLPTFFEHQRDPDAIQMAAFKPRDHEDFMNHWTNILANRTITKRSVWVDGQLAGNVLCFERSGEREVGYWIDRQFWGRGIATAALFELLKLVSFRPLCAHVAKHNHASIRVLEKCGFTFVGENKTFACDADGAPIEGLIMQLTADANSQAS